MTLDELRALHLAYPNNPDSGVVVALIDSHRALHELLQETDGNAYGVLEWINRRHAALAVAAALTRGDTEQPRLPPVKTLAEWKAEVKAYQESKWCAELVDQARARTRGDTP